MRKVLTISDPPLSTSGVARQSRLVIESLLETSKYEVISMACAIDHSSYSPYKTQKYGDSWRIFPTKGFEDLELLRSLIKTEEPDALWLMGDPRFFEKVWSIDSEIRPEIPIVYYHVWDNYPYPMFNKKYYHSNDVVVTISQLTQDILDNVAPGVKSEYLPHAINTEVYRPQEFDDVSPLLEANGISHEGKKIFFWNNRNAGRKQPATLLWWFKALLDEVGHDKAMLIMHTDPNDKNGPDLITNLEHLELTAGQVFLSNQKVPDGMLSAFYNIADCTINIPDAEGFGLSSLESLACGTPVISTLTGGLREQIFDGEQWYGVGIEPVSKAIVGSQKIPYIFEDRISSEDFISACKKIINMPRSDLKKWGKLGRGHVLRKYNLREFKKGWNKIFDSLLQVPEPAIEQVKWEIMSL